MLGTGTKLRGWAAAAGTPGSGALACKCTTGAQTCNTWACAVAEPGTACLAADLSMQQHAMRIMSQQCTETQVPCSNESLPCYGHDDEMTAECAARARGVAVHKGALQT